jgi:hypothetical protein
LAALSATAFCAAALAAAAAALAAVAFSAAAFFAAAFSVAALPFAAIISRASRIAPLSTRATVAASRARDSASSSARPLRADLARARLVASCLATASLATDAAEGLPPSLTPASKLRASRTRAGSRRAPDAASTARCNSTSSARPLRGDLARVSARTTDSAPSCRMTMLLLRVTATRGHAVLTNGMRVSDPATAVSWSTASAHIHAKTLALLF